MVDLQLPIFPLPQQVVLLPGTRMTLPIPREVAATIQDFMDQSEDSTVLLAALPTLQPPPDSVYSRWASVARVLRLVKPRSGSQTHGVTLHALRRAYLPTAFNGEPLSFQPVFYSEEDDQSLDLEAVDKFRQTAGQLLDRLARDSTQQLQKANFRRTAAILQDSNDSQLPLMADLIVAKINAEFEDRLAVLSTPDPSTRLSLASDVCIKATSISEVSKKIATSVDESLSKQQKDFFLRQQLAAIQRELQALHGNSSPNAPDTKSGSELDDDAQNDADDLAEVRQKIEAMATGSEERKMAVREWKRLKRIPQASAESGVIRSYLEWITALPWNPTELKTGNTTTSAFLGAAQAQLDADHYGLEKIKKRLIEYLAVVRLKEMKLAEQETAVVPYDNGKQASPPPKRRSVKGPILLFVGPPGTGKTSLGQSIAKALDRPFQRISLGGVRDEAEIRGHRRTYVASGPGLIVQALRKAERKDPVLLLDEIDKVGQSNFHGDPSAALLEVLDPEQNSSFNDHYINVPVDLSQVLFICTANSLDTISAPLLDRCEVIQLAGYTSDEKMHIARRFLLPKQLEANGLNADHLTLSEDVLKSITTGYTREAGVRSLERAIGSVVRFKAVEWAKSLGEERSTTYSSEVQEADLEEILGIPRWDGEEHDREERRGLVYGLVVMGQGEGGIMPVETSALPGNGVLKLTGSLGDVIKESGDLAMSWVKSHAYDLYMTSSRSQDPLKVPSPIDVHLHLPAGAQKKDGPSAGVAMVCAFVSLLTGACVPTHIAMTGEITLRGRVTPVGGIKEKVLGAHRAHMKKVILPWANRKDVEHDISAEIRKEIEIVFVKTVNEALTEAFGKGTLSWREKEILFESRL